MSGMRVGGLRPPIQPEQPTRPSDPKRTPETPPIAKENFVTSLVAARRPPHLPIGEVLSERPSPTATLFATELQSFRGRAEFEVASDLAAVYLDHVEDALDSGNIELAEAFETLGDLMRSYEHLRMLRTGELG